MSDTLLNPNQQRHVVTHLRLLREDLEDVASWPELARAGEPYASLRATLAALLAAVADLRLTLALPSDRPATLRRRVMATAEVWATSADDLKADQLRAYGRVHPGLGATLDGRSDGIAQLLRRMADEASALPDR